MSKFSDEQRAANHAKALADRAAQGLSDTVQDPAIIKRLGALLSEVADSAVAKSHTGQP